MAGEYVLPARQRGREIYFSATSPSPQFQPEPPSEI
jgi:hypothetical protein